MSRTRHPDHNEDDEEYGASPAHTRVKGLLLLIGGGGGTLIAMLLSAYLVRHGFFPSHGGVPAMVLIFIPMVIALAGFVELLTGLEIPQTAKKWDDLPGWQRGILIALFAFSPFIFYSVGVELF